MQPQGQGQQFQQAPPPKDTSVQEPEHEGVRIINPSPPIDPRTGQPMEDPLRDARTGEFVNNYMSTINPDNPNGSLGSVPTQESQGNQVFQHPPAQPDAANPAFATAPAPPPPPPPGGPNGPSDTSNSDLYPNNPSLSKYADTLKTADENSGISAGLDKPLKVPNDNNISPKDTKNIEDINRRREAFRRDLDNFKKSLTPDELKVYREVFG